MKNKPQIKLLEESIERVGAGFEEAKMDGCDRRRVALIKRKAAPKGFRILDHVVAITRYTVTRIRVTTVLQRK